MLEIAYEDDLERDRDRHRAARARPDRRCTARRLARGGRDLPPGRCAVRASGSPRTIEMRRRATSSRTPWPPLAADAVSTSPMPPNVLYIHSHDTGRYVQPYGHAIPTPNIQWLADQGVMFRNAFCAAPSCSGSRAALLTGEYCHTNGMMGLAHRGLRAQRLRPPHRPHAERRRLPHRADRRAARLRRARRPRLRHRPRDRRQHREPRGAGGDRGPLARDPAAVLHVGRILRDPPELLLPELGARSGVLAAAAVPPRHSRDPPGRRRLQGERPLARPGRRRGPQRAATRPVSTRTRSSSARPTTASRSRPPRRACSTAGSA